MADLWGRLTRTLRALEAVAADPARLEDAGDVLPVLQYELHWASELLAGVEPPPAGEAAHAELGSALTAARDMTGDVAEALADGGLEATAPLVHEWRGALFRVRLARSRLGLPPASALPADVPPFPRSALVSALLVVFGVAAFAGGAVAVLWPMWAAGLLMIAAGCVGYRS